MARLIDADEAIINFGFEWYENTSKQTTAPTAEQIWKVRVFE